MKTDNKNKWPKIAIYGVGYFGQAFVRAAVKKNLPIVAAFNRAGEKVGQDLGAVCNTEHSLNIRIQDLVSPAFDTNGAEIVVITARDAIRDNMAAYQYFMNAGLNVLCIGGQSNYPWGSDAEAANELHALALKNNVSFTGGGVWDACRIWPGLIATGACTHIDSLHHVSVTDIGAGGPAVLERMKSYGLGQTIEEINAEAQENDNAYEDIYKTVMHQVLETLGYRVTQVKEYREPIFYDKPVPCGPLARDLQPHECAGMRLVAQAQTKEGVTGRVDAEFRVCRPEEKSGYFSWEVKGVPGAKITYDRSNGADSLIGAMINRIPDVVAAASGIQDVSKLGPLKHSSLMSFL